MQNTVPYNINVPEFSPSREAPIYPGIVRRYPCQEDNVYAPNEDGCQGLRSLTWKIQQPDSNMVWTAVKLVLPLRLATGNVQGDTVDTRVGSRLPACNVALGETVMKCFRDTQLTLNGKVFNEVNYYRDILDTCYRGVGPQSYGDNHSLKPVVTRAIASKNATQYVSVRAQDGTATANRVRIDDIRTMITSNNESLLDNNGPFLERARLWQDGLSQDGTEWTGNVTAYLEAGPFQARARRGNTAVPYINDFHMKLNFVQNKSRYDQLRNPSADMNFAVGVKGRILAPRLLEFGTIANMQVPGEAIDSTDNFLGTIATWFTQKPYLEITYTKFMDPMRSSYLLRCYERQYQVSLPRFKLPPDGSVVKTARVTSRLLSYPTKIYLYAEVADEWKGSYIFGGVRRSCMLENIHCRINQRPDVIYNPSQEECFETFQRHTNSSLEYGAWRKAPIYVFTPADLKQSDMFANDARITWMEWDAEVSLTKLQRDEHTAALSQQAISAAGYVLAKREVISLVVRDQPFITYGGGVEPIIVRTDPQRTAALIKDDDAQTGIQWVSDRTENSTLANPVPWEAALASSPINRPFIQMADTHPGTGSDVPITSQMDIQLTDLIRTSQQFDGYIWALVTTTGGNKFKFQDNAVYYVPRSWRFAPLYNKPGDDPYNFINSWHAIEETVAGGVAVYNLAEDAVPRYAKGVIRDSSAGALQAKTIGADNAPNGVKTMSPGPVGYRFDHLGIRNIDTTYEGANQTYAYMGPMPFVAAPGDNQIMAANQVGGAHRWMCFAPPSDFIGGAMNHFKFRSTTHDTHDDVTTPVTFQAGAEVQSGYGKQRTFFYGTGANATVDAANKVAFTAKLDVNNQFDLLEGRRLGELVVNEDKPADDIAFEYQLKALYENGNCQYEFSADGTPSRVVDNLIAVGASSGIPTF